MYLILSLWIRAAGLSLTEFEIVLVSYLRDTFGAHLPFAVRRSRVFVGSTSEFCWPEVLQLKHSTN